jgi:hypothetical protein
MGKYPNSKLLNAYSQWHWDKCARVTMLVDQDIGLVYQPFVYRLWVEMREIQHQVKPVSVIDVKSMLELNKPLTKCSSVWYDWLIAREMPVYVVYVNTDFSNFMVQQYPDGKLIPMNESEYIKWLDNLTIVVDKEI